MCGYMETSETSKNWKTGSCFDLESYACKVPAGQSIHPFPKPVDFKCPSFKDDNFNWMLDPFENKCYLLPRNYGDQNYIFPNYDAADKFCKENNAVLATIHSADVNSWLTAHSPNDMWIGLKGTTMSSDIPSNENIKYLISSLFLI